MSYSPNIPNIGDFCAISQKQMLANFQAINEAWLIDHVPLTSNNNVGRHNALTFIYQTVDPVPTSSQSVLYTKLDANLIPQLFFMPSNPLTPIQLTNSNLNTAQTGAGGGDQVSFLAGPFTIYMGFVLNCPAVKPMILLPSTNLIYVGLSMIASNNNGLGNQNSRTPVAIKILGNTFDIVRNANLPADTIVYYTAIGL